MTVATTNLDPVSAAVALASVIFGPALAGFVGPYSIILLGSTVGASWALGRREPATSKWGAVWFFARLNTTAALLTVGIASIVGNWLGTLDHNWLLGPAAMLVGGVGDDWPRLGAWLLRRAARVAEKVTGTQSQHGDLE